MEEASFEKSRGWLGGVQREVSFFMIFLGMSLCLQRILDIYIPWRFSLTAAAGLAVGVIIMDIGRKWMAAGIVAFGGAFILILARYHNLLQLSLKETTNRVLELINDYYDTEYLLWHLKSENSYTWTFLFMCGLLLGFLEGLLILATKDKQWRLWMAALPPVLVIAAGLLLGVTASFNDIVLVLFGLLLQILDLRERGHFLLGTAVIISICISILFASNETLWKQVQVWHDQWQPKQLLLEDRMLEMIGQIVDSSLFSVREQRKYLLDNSKPEMTGKEMFEITVNYPVSSNLYLRGFIGGAYQNGTWDNVSKQEFSDWSQEQGKDSLEYARVVQSFPYDCLQYMPRVYQTVGWERKVSVKWKGEPRGYTLMPYFTKISDELPIKADGNVLPVRETDFQWDTFLELDEREVEWAATPVMEAFMEESDKFKMWKAYEAYTKEVYTRLPQEGLKKLRTYAQKYRKRAQKAYEKKRIEIFEKLEEAEQQNLYANAEDALFKEEYEFLLKSEQQQMVQMVQEMLWKDNHYSFDLKELPKSEDYTEYFLFEQHKGYCVHFATAATLLFRMNDIPARYVSGYLVLPSDFKKNEDGTYTAVVTDERAHAWTEIFEQNIGFHPIEATPPDYQHILENMKQGEHVTQAVETAEQRRQKKEDRKKKKQEVSAYEGKQRPKKEQKPMTQKTQKDTVKKESSSTKDNGIFGMAVKRIAIFVLAIAGSYLFLWYRRKWILKKRWERFNQKNRTQSVKEIAKEFAVMLRLMDLSRKTGMSDRDYQAVLEQKLPDINWQQAFALFQKAAFSQDDLTEEEYQRTLSLYHQMGQRITQKRGVRGWFLKYILIYP